MMISAAPPEARQSHPSPQPTNCSPKREQRGLPIEIRRMVGMETAFEILGGKGELAGALGITVRALNYKLNADRGVSNLDLTLAANTLETRGKKMLDHARKLREEAWSAMDVSATSTPTEKPVVVGFDPSTDLVTAALSLLNAVSTFVEICAPFVDAGRSAPKMVDAVAAGRAAVALATGRG